MRSSVNEEQFTREELRCSCSGTHTLFFRVLRFHTVLNCHELITGAYRRKDNASKG